MDKTETRPWPAQLIKHFENLTQGTKQMNLLLQSSVPSHIVRDRGGRPDILCYVIIY